MPQLVRRFAVGLLGLTALVSALVGVAPQQAAAQDAFTVVGCPVGNYQCLYARNGVNPNAVQIDVSQFRNFYGYNPYFYGIGNNAPYFYGNTAPFSYGYSPYFYGGNIYSQYSYGPFGYNPNFFYGPPSGSFVGQNTTPNDGFCNIGYGEKNCVRR